MLLFFPRSLWLSYSNLCLCFCSSVSRSQDFLRFVCVFWQRVLFLHSSGSLPRSYCALSSVRLFFSFLDQHENSQTYISYVLMCIQPSVNQAQLAFFFFLWPTTRPNISLGHHGNEPKAMFCNPPDTLAHTPMSVSVCLWIVALKHTINIHTVSTSLVASLSWGLFPDIVVLKWLFLLLLLLLYWWVVFFFFFLHKKGVKVFFFFFFLNC